MNASLPILSLALLVAGVIGLILQQALIARLCKRHRKVWECLHESSAGILAFDRFLWLKQYRTLGDAQFNRRAGFLRGYWIAFFVMFIVVVIVAFASIGLRK